MIKISETFVQVLRQFKANSEFLESFISNRDAFLSKFQAGLNKYEVELLKKLDRDDLVILSFFNNSRVEGLPKILLGIEALLQKLASDDHFLCEFLEDRLKAVKASEIPMTPTELEIIQVIPEKMIRLAGAESYLHSKRRFLYSTLSGAALLLFLYLAFYLFQSENWVFVPSARSAGETPVVSDGLYLPKFLYSPENPFPNEQIPPFEDFILKEDISGEVSTIIMQLNKTTRYRFLSMFPQGFNQKRRIIARSRGRFITEFLFDICKEISDDRFYFSFKYDLNSNRVFVYGEERTP